MHDLWRQKDLGNYSGAFEATVPGHGAVLATVLHTALGQVALASFDSNAGIITDTRWQHGVPLGGIGAGKVELLRTQKR